MNLHKGRPQDGIRHGIGLAARSLAVAALVAGVSPAARAGDEGGGRPSARSAAESAKDALRSRAERCFGKFMNEGTKFPDGQPISFEYVDPAGVAHSASFDPERLVLTCDGKEHPIVLPVKVRVSGMEASPSGASFVLSYNLLGPREKTVRVVPHKLMRTVDSILGKDSFRMAVTGTPAAVAAIAGPSAAAR